MALVELLAPAGSFDSMKAAIHAGADAVYMGGTRFGARAYAENPEEDMLLEAIAYAHLHGRKLYLTVNTLLKEKELEEELYEYLRPYYEAGVDAVIVQDFGVLCCIRQWFPDLPVHASTQMTMTGPGSGAELERLGVTRIVTPRELSLKEISEIRKNCGLEIETFVHGALCYCYSGQCLYSSIVGGRSGNRGRCAQPCRMEYQLYAKEDGRPVNKKEERYLLSPKDLNALDVLPDLLEAGVNSLKIEGRMKKPVYAAGVVSIYRKYVDLYLKYGRRGYHVDPADQQKLWDLFNRKGFTQGYFRQHNGREMITLTKPDFRPGNDSFQKQLKQQYIDMELQENVKGIVMVRQHLPVTMELSCKECTITCIGDIPQTANSRPVTEESVRKQMSKFGGTGFRLEQLDVLVEEGLFVSITSLNALRRNAAEQLRRALVEEHVRKANDSYGREDALSRCWLEIHEKEIHQAYEYSPHWKREDSVLFAVSVEEKEQLDEVLAFGECDRIYIDSLAEQPEYWKRTVERIHETGAAAFLAMPRIFRAQAVNYFKQHRKQCAEAGFDGYLVRTIEELVFLQENGLEGIYIGDHMLYAWNRASESYLHSVGIRETTVPMELNFQEWQDRGVAESEVILYGRIPMMVSAQCLKKTVQKCEGRQTVSYLKDRTGAMLPVKNSCPYCYNVIYNSYTMSIIDEWPAVRELSPASVRCSFTTEKSGEVRQVLQVWQQLMQGKEVKLNRPQLTKGHFRRGVQ